MTNGKEKLRILFNPVYNNVILNNDRKVLDSGEAVFAGDEVTQPSGAPDYKPPKQQIVFNIWLKAVRKNKELTSQEFEEVFASFPNIQEKVSWWERSFDEEGNPVTKKSQEERDANREKNRAKRQRWRKKKRMQKKSHRPMPPQLELDESVLPLPETLPVAVCLVPPPRL